jgi:Glycosyltransferase family 87
VARELGVKLTWSRFFVCGAATLSSAAFTTVAVTCEMTFLVMPVFTLLWMAWRNRRWRAVGVWLGVCASLKLFMLLFVPYLLWRRRWDALATMGVVAAMLVISGCVAFGIDTYHQWFRSLGKVGWWWLPMNASWQGFVARLFQGGGTRIAALVQLPSVVPVATILGAGVVSVCALARVICDSGREHEGDRDFVTLFLGALLASPLGWVYYLPLAYGPILGWLGGADGWSELRRLVTSHRVMVGCGLALLYIPHEAAALGQPSAVATLTLASAYFWGVSLLWTASLAPWRSPHR